MKKYIFLIQSILCIALVTALLSCDDFLSQDPSLSTDTGSAFETPNDYKTAATGIYYTFGRHQFLGRSAIAIGDIASDITNHDAATTHFLNIFNYQIQATNTYLLDIWSGGYEVIDRSTRLIVASPNTLSGVWSDSEKDIIYRSVAQAYAAKALTTFYLVNIYGLPYSDTNKSKPGVVVTDVPVDPSDQVSRSSIEDTYAKILEYIEKAKENYAMISGSLGVPKSQLNLAAVFALESRVKLYIKDYQGSITAAEEALALLPNSYIISSEEEYNACYSSIKDNVEDIFYIAKNEQDNLTANSINTLYNNYGVSIATSLINQYSSSDIRKGLLSAEGGKYAGAEGNNQMSNIPILRVPELYLNMAEAYAMIGTDYASAKSNLLEVVSKRDPSFDEASIAEDASIIDIIFNERAKELVQEGHRFFDLRRTGREANVSGGSAKNFKIYNFVYPIPAAEINSGAGVTQNENWSDNLPD